jgi:capsular polysaccharide biosynthesis protein
MHKANFYTIENRPLSELFIKEVKNCIITRSLLVMTAKGVDRSCLYKNLPIGKEFQMNLVGAASVLKNRLHKLNGDQDNFFTFNPWGGGYYHWLTEVAVKFLLFESELRKGRVLVPENAPRFVTDFLELFEFSNVQALKDNSFARSLKVITNPHTSHYHIDHLSLLRRRILSKVASVKDNFPRRIYVSRRFARARYVVNDEEVTETLKGLGFHCVYLEDTPFADQVNLFRHCELLVSIHGAALTNAVFMPANSKVIEFYPEAIGREKDIFRCFLRLSHVLGLQHQFVFCGPEHEFKRAPLDTGNIRVDISDLRKAVEAGGWPVKN